jgi:hypothetical protein
MTAATRNALVLWVLALPMAAQTAVPSNSVVIKNLRNSEQRDRPFTISRIFAEGAFRGCVQAVVDGTLLETQCDPQNRWPDKTLRHALISFRLTLPANKSVTVEFVSGDANSGPGMDVRAMLAKAETQGQIQLAGATTLTADVRRMIEDGAVRYRLNGPICTQAIVEDRDSTMRFDLGWDAHRSFHPIFVLTYYQGWSGVKVEMIGENAWTSKLQDLSYRLDLHTGNPLKRVYSKAVLHHAATRWRKVFWSGDEPGPVSIDYNLPYLVYSRALPSYDLTKKVSDSAAKAQWDEFNSGDKGDIPDRTSPGRAQWTVYMPTTGGRGDIGVIPRWYVRYLYRMSDPNMYEVMLGNAAASGHVPIHYRESAAGRCFHGTGPRCPDAFGRPLSLQARPTYTVVVEPPRAEVDPKDLIEAVGPIRCAVGPPICNDNFSNSPDRGHWTPQPAHLPDMAYVPYLITGDWYYLEELQFWSSWVLANLPHFSTADWARHREWGYLNAGGYGGATMEVRGKAWAFRTLVFTALSSAENTPERSYYFDKVYSNIAVDEGRLNVRDGAFYEPCGPGPYDAYKTSMWCWGRTTLEYGRPNPLGFPSYNGSCRSNADWLQEGANRTWDRCGAPWQLNFVHTVWGVAQDMGITQIGALRRAAAKSLLHMIVHPDTNPFLIASYDMPILKKVPGGEESRGEGYPSVREVRSQFVAERTCSNGSKDQLRDKPGWSCPTDAGVADPGHGYAFIAKAAASFLVGVDDGPLQGAAAWAWFRQNLDDRGQNDEPTWALTPREYFGRAAQDTPIRRSR